MLLLFIVQVVERERTDSKTEQEELNSKIQDLSKALEVLLSKVSYLNKQCKLSNVSWYSQEEKGH